MSKLAAQLDEKPLLTLVPAGLHDAWKKFAKDRGLTLKALQVLVMRQVLGLEGDVGLQPRSLDAGGGKRPSLSIRLFLDEIEQVKQAAAVEGHSIGGWLAALIRAKLKQTPIVTTSEVDALHKTSLQLMAVGRNLNTAVRRLSQDERWTSQVTLMEHVLQEVRRVEASVNAIQQAAERRGSF
ncbi:hypothetical protein LMG31884_47000 (plasmid) [Xanthomonas hydrangeae]|uniref:hypothetical protein n=1 Tax=Xanthomonas hydrangeae TaxID=2775159 RepID=UPI0019622D24|nr:hypothetical protein LMG31884_47000 [Xanthomonas hydrangeae]CAD7740880.1 hypothetical protein LMG31884_47000 [Xanthomonas hydrangeae]CAD7747856.1 hypothetical protein LMG31887_45990 [Xanthomonas hydrangeae]CAD7747857.1 hypothetical protein LMG31887_45990 [Xanthomonas hydrangeae]CAD7748266.1 hypothetical protein LMG31885_45500 [Xanthomonas hydrangeae]